MRCKQTASLVKQEMSTVYTQSCSLLLLARSLVVHHFISTNAIDFKLICCGCIVATELLQLFSPREEKKQLKVSNLKLVSALTSFINPLLKCKSIKMQLN